MDFLERFLRLEKKVEKLNRKFCCLQSEVLSEIEGGTGQNSYNIGDILYASGENTLTVLPAGEEGQVLTISGGIPTWITP